MTASTTQDLTTMTPGEIDTILSELWLKEQTYRGYIAQERGRIAKPWRPLSEREVAEIEGRIAKYQEVVDEQRAQARPFEAEFTRRGGWARYFLVSNNNGHVHRERECSTCFPTTQFVWLPTLSGKTDEEMVAEWGEVACTVCFPSAPTFKGFGDGTSAFARLTAAEREARDAEKAAKRAAKAEKELVEPVRTGWGTIKTVVAARNEISRLTQNAIFYSRQDAKDVADMAALAAALIVKGWTQEQIEQIKVNAMKKARKEMG